LAEVVEQTPEDDALLKRVRAALEVAEPYHRRFRNRGNHYWSLYHSVNDFRSAYSTTSTPRGRDAVINDAAKQFGAEFFIPIAYTTVETVLPKILANRPKMKAEPRDSVSIPNVPNVEALIDLQQDQMNYELVLQTIAKDGAITGLGVQKVMWKNDYRRRKKVVASGQSALDMHAAVPPEHMAQKHFAPRNFGSGSVQSGLASLSAIW